MQQIPSTYSPFGGRSNATLFAATSPETETVSTSASSFTESYSSPSNAASLAEGWTSPSVSTEELPSSEEGSSCQAVPSIIFSLTQQPLVSEEIGLLIQEEPEQGISPSYIQQAQDSTNSMNSSSASTSTTPVVLESAEDFRAWFAGLSVNFPPESITSTSTTEFPLTPIEQVVLAHAVDSSQDTYETEATTTMVQGLIEEISTPSTASYEQQSEEEPPFLPWRSLPHMPPEVQDPSDTVSVPTLESGHSSITP